MAEQTPSSASAASAGTDLETSATDSGHNSRSGGQTGRYGRGQAASLQSENGTTSISEAVVTKVAGIAAREVPGVHDLGGGVSKALSGVTSRVGIGDDRTQGVDVEVGEREAAVDLTVIVDYGESIPEVSEAIRDNVIQRIEGITGLSVTEVNVQVNDLYFPGDEQPEQPARVA